MLPPAGLREAFDLHPEATYLNAAGEGPLPRAAREALLAAADRKVHPFRVGGEDYFQVPRRTRELCARLVGAGADEIALTAGTGAGINLALAGLPLAPGDEILHLKGDFPALVNPILHARSRGLVPVEVAGGTRGPSVEDFRRRITPRSRVLAVSHVLSSSGVRLDLAALSRLCREHSMFLVVDAAQSAGIVPIDRDRDGWDLLAAPAHKWLLGPPGCGFAAIRPEVLEKMTPPAVGWMASLNSAAQFAAPPPPFDLRRIAGGRRFEVGTTPYLTLAAWNASLELILGAGVEAVLHHVTALLEPLAGYLAGSPYPRAAPPDPAHRSGILSFTGRFPAKLYLLLTERKIFPALRQGSIRVSPHLYNRPEDIERLIAALKELESVKLEADQKGENL